MVLGAVRCCRVLSFPPPANLHHLQQDQGVGYAEFPNPEEQLAVTVDSHGVEQADVALNCS